MVTVVLAAAFFAAPNVGGDCSYTLNPVGIELESLPAEICPLVEGSMSRDEGAVAGQPNSLGISFGCYYWKADNPVENKDLWLREKLSSVLPPDLIRGMRTSEVSWEEGSTESGARGARSLGLTTMINFTFSPQGGSLGRGRAYGVFRNGYSVLLVMFGPSRLNPQEYLGRVVANSVLSDDSSQ